MKINDILNEDGVIVPGVNTTVDVKPGQTEKEAAKFFGHGKPKELHAKARKNSDPNTLYNMGLVESEQLNEIFGPAIKAAIKKYGKPVFDAAMSDPRVHSAWLSLQRNFANAGRIPADAVQQWIDFAVKVGGGAAAGAATAIGFDRKRDQQKLDQMMDEPVEEQISISPGMGAELFRNQQQRSPEDQQQMNQIAKDLAIATGLGAAGFAAPIATGAAVGAHEISRDMVDLSQGDISTNDFIGNRVFDAAITGGLAGLGLVGKGISNWFRKNKIDPSDVKNAPRIQNFIKNNIGKISAGLGIGAGTGTAVGLDEDTSRGIDLTQYNYNDVLQRLDQLNNIFTGLANKELSFADHNVVDLSTEAEQLRKVRNEFERQDAQARADATSSVGSNREINLGSPTSTNEPTLDPSVSNDGSIISRSIAQRDADGNVMLDKDGNVIFDRYGVDYDPEADQDGMRGTLIPDEFGSPLGQEDGATTQRGYTRDRDAYQQDANLKDLQRLTAIGKEYALSRMDKAKEPWTDPETGEYNTRKLAPMRAVQYESTLGKAIGTQGINEFFKKSKEGIKQSDPLKVLDNIADRKDNKEFPIKMYDGSTIGVRPSTARRIITIYLQSEDDVRTRIEQALKTKNGFKELLMKVETIEFNDNVLAEAWSKKYKRSIDCSNPKGFSQKAHCAGRNK